MNIKNKYQLQFQKSNFKNQISIRLHTKNLALEKNFGIYKTGNQRVKKKLKNKV
jgi:hypothetical protein